MVDDGWNLAMNAIMHFHALIRFVAHEQLSFYNDRY